MEIKINKNITPINPDLKEYCSSRMFGLIYDMVLKQELSVINFDKQWQLLDGSIKRYNNNIKIDKDYILKNFNKDLLHYKCIEDKSLISDMFYDIQNLIKNIDFNLFLAKDLFIKDCSFRHPYFGEMGYNYGEIAIKPDLIIDNRIIEIKTYNNIDVSKKDLLQLLVYATWVNSFSKVKITQIEIFFSKHNYLWQYALSKEFLHFMSMVYLENIGFEDFKEYLYEDIGEYVGTLKIIST